MTASGNFFAIDRRVWAEICDQGKMNPAVAYLVMARGTQRDLRTTSWSVHAIEERTGIPRLSAKLAVNALINDGFVEKLRGGTKPQYRLRNATAVIALRRATPALSVAQSAALERIRQHPDGIKVPQTGGVRLGWQDPSPHRSAASLARLGLVTDLGGTVFAPAERAEPENIADWIWLPNSIVDGIDGETSPIERIRQSHRIGAIRLFVNLYQAQALSTDGGVNWRKLRKSYTRHELGQWKEFNIYGFMPDKFLGWPSASFIEPHMTGKTEKLDANKSNNSVDIGWPEFWGSLDILIRTGLVEAVPHLVDADSDEGVVMHPLAGAGEGEGAERDVGAAAHAAARAMLTSLGLPSDYVEEVRLVPVRRHIEKVSLVGLLRLRYRANTSATAAWFERMDEWREWATRYRAHEQASPAAAALGGLRATSTVHQR